MLMELHLAPEAPLAPFAGDLNTNGASVTLGIGAGARGHSVLV
jgi:hypothetical protein